VSRGLADTSLFIARESHRTFAVAEVPDELAVSVITIGELRAGVLAAADVETRDRRLTTLTTALETRSIPITDRVAEQWAKLRLALREAGRRMPVNDSWIAATAIALDVQDADYDDVPRLEVIRI